LKKVCIKKGEGPGKKEGDGRTSRIAAKRASQYEKTKPRIRGWGGGKTPRAPPLDTTEWEKKKKGEILPMRSPLKLLANR